MLDLPIMLQWGIFILIALGFYLAVTALWMWNNSLMREIEAAFWDEPEPQPDLYRLDWSPNLVD